MRKARHLRIVTHMAAPMTPSDRAFEWTVGDRIRKAREATGNHNARQFYEGLGLNRDRMSRVERGVEDPRISDLATVSWATGFSVEALRGDDRHPTPPTGGLISGESSSACTSSPLAVVVPLPLAA